MASTITVAVIFFGVLFERIFTDVLVNALIAYEFWSFLVAIAIRGLTPLLPGEGEMTTDICVTALGIFIVMVLKCGTATNLRDQESRHVILLFMIVSLGAGIGMVAGSLIFKKLPWFLQHMIMMQAAPAPAQ